jgi:hypothetical protein
MSRKAVIDAVKTRQAANWTTLPVSYPNERVTIPADLTGFVVIENPVGRGEQHGIGAAGSRRFSEEGGFRVVIHVPLGAGWETAYTYADELATVFRGVKLEAGSGSLDLWAPGPPIPQGQDGAYYKIAFSIPYTFQFAA